MTRTPLVAVFVLGVAFVFSGCVSAEEDPAASSTNAEPDHMDEALAEFLHGFEVEMKGCKEAGGVSLYAMPREGSPGPAEPLTRADIKDDTGDPMIGSYFAPIPAEDGATGIWHTSVTCESYSYMGEARGPFNMGWVGVRIHPPPWDDSGIERQFFVADFSIMDRDIVVDLQANTGSHVSRMLDNRIEWLAPTFLHTMLDDEDHGVFETHGHMSEYRAMEDERMRFWMYVSSDGQHHHAGEGVPEGVQFRPISFDLVNTGGGTQWVADDGSAWLSHTRTDAHGSVPAATGNTGAVLYDGFDRTMRLGPQPDLLFNSTWLH